MGKCSVCGGNIHNNLAVYLNNSYKVSNKNIHVKATICKNCIESMYNHLNELEEKINDEHSEVTEFIKHLNTLFDLYMDGVNHLVDKTKLSEIPISLPMGLAEQFTNHVRPENMQSMFEFFLKTAIEQVYEEVNYANLPIKKFIRTTKQIFNAQVNELKNQIITDFNEEPDFSKLFNGPTETINTKSSVAYEEDKDTENEFTDDFELLTPSQIKAKLDKYIIGQERAKKIVSVGIYNHYKRIKMGKKDIKKSNIMLIGATGSGKTEIARTVAKILNVPFCIADATSITSAGYVGDDAEDMLLKLIQIADGDIEKAEHGIIYIDEIDKLARVNESSSIRDVGGEGVQQALLKIVEGSNIDIQIRNGHSPIKETITINTENILFICGGAFEHITMDEHKTKLGIGFNSSEVEPEYNTSNIDSKAIIKYGIIPELVGRFPIIAKLETLDVDDLKRILIEPENSVVKQYKDLIGIENVKLNFSDDALTWIAKKAVENKTGARGLKTIIEDNMLDIMYDLPDEDDISTIQVGVKDNILNIKKNKKRTKK